MRHFQVTHFFFSDIMDFAFRNVNCRVASGGHHESFAYDIEKNGLVKSCIFLAIEITLTMSLETRQSNGSSALAMCRASELVRQRKRFSNHKYLKWKCFRLCLKLVGFFGSLKRRLSRECWFFPIERSQLMSRINSWVLMASDSRSDRYRTNHHFVGSIP